MRLKYFSTQETALSLWLFQTHNYDILDIAISINLVIDLSIVIRDLMLDLAAGAACLDLKKYYQIGGPLVPEID